MALVFNYNLVLGDSMYIFSKLSLISIIFLSVIATKSFAAAKSETKAEVELKTPEYKNGLFGIRFDADWLTVEEPDIIEPFEIHIIDSKTGKITKIPDLKLQKLLDQIFYFPIGLGNVVVIYGHDNDNKEVSHTNWFKVKPGYLYRIYFRDLPFNVEEERKIGWNVKEELIY